MTAYQTALGQMPTSVGIARTVPGSMNDLCVRYYAAVFPTLSPLTQKGYRNVIERLRREHGDKSVAGLQRDHIRAMMSKLVDRPGAANKLLRTIKTLMRFAIDEGMRADDPTSSVRKFRRANDEGFHAWTEDEITRFETCHLLGTKARLAFDLLLWTAQRRNDVIRMGPQHVHDGHLKVRQSKTRAELQIPVLEPLRMSLAATELGHLCFLTTAGGKPFSAAGFGNWFRDRCNEAGLYTCSAHGLRKAATRRLAEAGCTDEEMMAWTGHASRAMLTLYSRGSNQQRGADAGASKLITSRGPAGGRLAVKPLGAAVKPAANSLNERKRK